MPPKKFDPNPCRACELREFRQGPCPDCAPREFQQMTRERNDLVCALQRIACNEGGDVHAIITLAKEALAQEYPDAPSEVPPQAVSQQLTSEGAPPKPTP